MYIKKYWGNFIGGSDDSLNLVAFLEDQKKAEIPLSEIFTKIGLDKQKMCIRDRFLGFLPCSPHCKPEVQEDNALNGNRCV